MDPRNPLDNLEDLGGLSECEPFGSYIENYKDAVINNVNRDPRAFDTSKPCLVCNKTGHTFDECPILNNVPLLRKHYISWKIYLAKESRRLMELDNEAQIQQLRAEYQVSEEEQDQASPDTIEFSNEQTAQIHNTGDFRLGEL